MAWARFVLDLSDNHHRECAGVEGSHWDGYSFLPHFSFESVLHQSHSSSTKVISSGLPNGSDHTHCDFFVRCSILCFLLLIKTSGRRVTHGLCPGLWEGSVCVVQVWRTIAHWLWKISIYLFVVLGNGVLCIQTTFGRNWAFICTAMKQKAKIRNTCEKFPIFYWGGAGLNIWSKPVGRCQLPV